MKGGAIPFVDDDSDDAGLMYDDIGGVAPAPFEKEPSSAPEPANNALPDLTPEPTKKKKSGKDVLGVTTKKIRPKFTENDLAKDNGLEWLPKHAPKRAKFQGRDITDARRLVDTYRAWAKQLFPSVPLDELLQRTDKFGHKMFVRGLVENLRDLQRREVRLAKRRARGEVIEEDVVEETKPIEDKKAKALALKAKKQAEREAQREMEELMRQREDVIDEEGEALMDLMDAEEGHGPPPPRRPAPAPAPVEDDLDAAMAAFDEAAAAAPSEPAPAAPMATEPSSAPAAAMTDADEQAPAATQDVAPTQIVPPTQDVAMDECAPTQPVPPSQACDLVEESALEFNSQPSQDVSQDEEAEFQF